jgi:hypothetical protein
VNCTLLQMKYSSVLLYYTFEFANDVLVLGIGNEASSYLPAGRNRPLKYSQDITKSEMCNLFHVSEVRVVLSSGVQHHVV